jgi:ATP-dependent DNA helicase RecQ
VRTVELFNEGYSPEEIAVNRRVTLRTIEDHLAQAIAAGADVDIARLVPPARRRAIEAVFADFGTESLLKPVMERLGEGYSYSEIMFVRAALQARNGLTKPAIPAPVSDGEPVR